MIETSKSEIQKIQKAKRTRRRKRKTQEKVFSFLLKIVGKN